MKKLTLLILSPLILLIFGLWLTPGTAFTRSGESMSNENSFEQAEVFQNTESAYMAGKITSEEEMKQDLVDYALSLIGSPYVYGGKSEAGFDCSGYITYVFEQFDLKLGRSSKLQAVEGKSIERTEARQGDLVIFTGTDLNVREPGHVGIVISSPGDTITFVHSSSVGGVKISQVEGTRYDDRILDVRRVL